MKSTATLAPARSGRSFLRSLALVLALTFGLSAGAVFTTATGQAYAAPALAARALTWAAPAVIDLVMPPAADNFSSVGDIDYFTYSGGASGGGTPVGPGGGGGGSNESPEARKRGGKAGALFDLLGALAGAGAIEAAFRFGDETPADYADPEPTGGTTAGGTFTFPQGRCTPTVTVERNMAGDSTGVYGFRATITADAGACTNSFVRGGQLNADGTAGSQTFTVSGNVGATQTFTLSSSLPGGWLDAYNGLVYVDRQTFSSTDTPGTPVVDPGTTPVTTTTTSNCSGGSTPSSSVTYTRSENGGAFTIPACPAGEHRTGVTQTSTTADGRTVDSPIPNLTTPVTPPSYAECQPTGSCQLVLTRHANGTGQQVASTATNLEPFREWQTLTSTSTGAGTRTVTLADGSESTQPRRAYPDGSTLECRFGPYLVPYADCESVPTERVPPAGGDESNCDGSDFSFNPVSWVVVPLKCLFIPRDSAVQAAATAVSSAWDGTAPAVVVDSFTDVFAPVVALKDDAVEDCDGPPFTFPALAGVTDPFTIHPLSTCNELTAYLLGIWMPLSTAFVYLGGFFAGTRLVLKTFGAESPVQA